MPNYHFDLRRRGIGDTIVASALTRDLVEFDFDTRILLEGNSCDQVFEAEPWYVTGPLPDAIKVQIDYKPVIDRGGLGDHSARYIYAAHEDFAANSGFAVHRGPSRPYITLTEEEQIRPYAESYCVVASGVKGDMPVKLWGRQQFQEVISATQSWNWKQVGIVHDGRLAHRQEMVDGAENLIERTPLRKLFRLIAHAECVLCHLSMPMLVAAAFQVPCVVVAGGRESPWLFEDMGVKVLHTIGELDCCSKRGCYASAALADKRPDEFPPGWLCKRPVQMLDQDQDLAKCMTLIKPETVIEALKAELELKNGRMTGSIT